MCGTGGGGCRGDCRGKEEQLSRVHLIPPCGNRCWDSQSPSRSRRAPACARVRNPSPQYGVFIRREHAKAHYRPLPGERLTGPHESDGCSSRTQRPCANCSRKWWDFRWDRKTAKTAKSNAPTRDRTWDPLIKSQLLYQLSYRRALQGGKTSPGTAPLSTPTARPAPAAPARRLPAPRRSYRHPAGTRVPRAHYRARGDP